MFVKENPDRKKREKKADSPILEGRFLLVVGCFRSFLTRYMSFQVISGSFSKYEKFDYDTATGGVL